MAGREGWQPDPAGKRGLRSHSGGDRPAGGDDGGDVTRDEEPVIEGIVTPASSEVVPAGPSHPPTGWYSDPANSEQLRYWDGLAWTEHIAFVPYQQMAGSAGTPASVRSSKHNRTRLAIAVVVAAAIVIVAVAIASAGNTDKVRLTVGSPSSTSTPRTSPSTSAVSSPSSTSPTATTAPGHPATSAPPVSPSTTSPPATSPPATSPPPTSQSGTQDSSEFLTDLESVAVDVTTIDADISASATSGDLSTVGDDCQTLLDDLGILEGDAVPSTLAPAMQNQLNTAERDLTQAANDGVRRQTTTIPPASPRRRTYSARLMLSSTKSATSWGNDLIDPNDQDLSEYTITGGPAEADRLARQAQVMAASTGTLLSEIGVGPGWACLEVGCGDGQVVVELAHRVGSTGLVVGVDIDAQALELARRATDDSSAPVELACGDIREFEETDRFDLAYARLVLSHLIDPATALRAVHSALHPGGVAAVEDLFTGTLHSDPAHAALDRLQEVYSATVRRHGGDPTIGPRLSAMLAASGFENIRERTVSNPMTTVDQKLFLVELLDNMRPAILAAGVANVQELDDIRAGVDRAARDQQSVFYQARIHQVWGHRRREETSPTVEG